jgi:PIN domain nuclease of toxin-antitoxin system
VILLDTHAWVWLASAPQNLSVDARIAMESADSFGVSAISPWEVAMLAKKGRIRVDIDVRTWVQAALALPKVALVPLSPETAILAVELRNGVNRDPADCIIVATAISEGLSLISKDRRVRAFPGVQTIW